MKKQQQQLISNLLLATITLALWGCQKEEVIATPEPTPPPKEVRVITDAPLSPESKALVAKAEKGNVEAQKELAERYLSGQGLSINRPEAAKWLKAAAQAGDPEACLDYAEMLEEGKYIPKNLQEAAYYYQSAADLGLIQASYELGKMYYEDFQQPEIRKDGLARLKDIGRKNYLPADLYLGYMYFHDANSAGAPEEAFYWYSKAAEQNNIYGLLALAYMYGNGIGTLQDINKSDEYYKKTLDQVDLSTTLFNQGTQISDKKEIQYHQEIAYALVKFADVLSMELIQKQKINSYLQILSKKMDPTQKARAEEFFIKLQDPNSAFSVISNIQVDTLQ